LGGLVLWVTALYHAPRPNKGRAHPGGGLYPELAALGFHQGQSAALVSRVARTVALLPSFAVAHRELARDGLGHQNGNREPGLIESGLVAGSLSARDFGCLLTLIE
jgi:hypothetical protein